MVSDYVRFADTRFNFTQTCLFFANFSYKQSIRQENLIGKE